MKIKIIKDSEVIVSKEEYERLLKKSQRHCEKDCYAFSKSIANGTAKYECDTLGSSYLVAIFGENVAYPIKWFQSPDPDYNRVCAEELVELLNQKQ